MDEIRETIENRREEMTAGPTSAFDQFEEQAREDKVEAEAHPDYQEGHTETEPVSDDERLDRPVGTETDSY